MVSVILTIGLILIIAGLFLFSGMALWTRTGIRTHVAFRCGLSFFIGVAVFITSFGALQSIFESYQVSLIIATVILGLIAVFLKPSNLPKLSLMSILLLTGCFCFLFLLYGLHSLEPQPRSTLNPVTASYAFGPHTIDHSFRVENIAVDAKQHDRWPYLNQNSGQALLGSVPLAFGLDRVQVALLVWYTLIVIASGALVYGAARSFLDARMAFLPTSLVMVGNAALSYRDIPLNDFGHAIGIIYNFESVIGLGLAVGMVLITYSLLNIKDLPIVRLGTLLISSYALSITAGHVFFVTIAIITLLAFIYYKKIVQASIAVILCSVGFIIGTAHLGGMLALNANPSDIPGVQMLSSTNEEVPLISLRPFRTVEAFHYSDLKWKYLLYGPSEPVVPAQNSPSSTDVLEDMTDQTEAIGMYAFIDSLKKNETIWNSIRILRSVQITFFALLGAMFACLALARRWHKNEVEKLLYIYTVPLMFGGWVIASAIEIYGKYQEPSRFFGPGISVSMFVLGLGFAYFWQKSETRLTKMIVVSVFLLSVVPSAVGYIVPGTIGNFVLPTRSCLVYQSRGGDYIDCKDVTTVNERLDLLFAPASMHSGE